MQLLLKLPIIINNNSFKVDFMLGSYMEDIGIKPKQFEEACGKGSKRSFQHGLFEQVKIMNSFYENATYS